MHKIKVILIFSAVGAVFVPTATIFAETGNNLQERLQKTAEQQNIQLSDVQRTLVVERCEFAQNSIRDQAAKTETAVRKRQASVEAAQRDMLALKLRLARQSTDASELELLRGRLQQYSDELAVASAAYGQAVSDALTVSCRERPELFMAALFTVRGHRVEQLAAARKMTKALRDTPTNTVPAIKQRLVL